MFEGLVRQLILGYLGQYVKDIQEEQLKITLWNEEVLLENVELILEAFEYLQLPFSLKEGRVGRLSIKIPWKKLGWDPIIIILEDVFVCASQRDEREWRLEEVEKREFAGKKAKLAAAELAKLSRRVCDNQAGQSFISYITAKILDSIQVSIRNFHVSYKAIQNDPQSDCPVVLGLRFSSLTIMKQTSVGMRGQVNKTVEICGLEVYCSSCSGASSLATIDSTGVSKSLRDSTYDANQRQHVLSPLDVSVSLSVDRSGKLNDDAPQYSIGVEITHMVMCLDEFQLRQILILLDDLCICRLRERYGRYRPLCSLSSGKPNNWQRLWWQYAQQSVLSDVRKKLRRTSWRYFGVQLSYRRKYVNLYKKKLLFLKQEQSVDEEIVEELEQMEKESDINDILNYRSTAERELQEHFFDPATSASGFNRLERSRNDSSGKSRGWLNWLSRGMLGAGGTEDSSQFSGIVSDEVIKDIYEATEFDPPAVTYEDDTTTHKMFKCSFNLFVQQFSATVGCTKSWENGAELLLDEIAVECKLWEESASMVSAVGNVRIIRPHDQKVIVIGGMDNLQNAELPSCRISINVLPMQELELSLKVMIQPLKITFDADFLLNCMVFFGVFQSFEFHHDRVLSSLNGVKDDRARILSKAEYALASPTKVAWEFSVLGTTLSVPWCNDCSEHAQLVFQCGNLSMKSVSDLHEDGSHILKDFLASFPKSDFAGIQFQLLYDHFEITLIDAEVKLVKSSISKSVPILEKFSFSVFLASSIIPNEELLKQLEVLMTVSTLRAHFSPTIYVAAMELIMYGDGMFQQSEFASAKSFTPSHSKSNYVDSTFNFAIAVNMGTVYLDVNLENEDGGGYACLLCMKEMDMRGDVSNQLECWICTKALKVISYVLKDEKESHTLCSFGASFEMKPVQPYFVPNDSPGKNDGIGAYDPCFLLRYESCRGKPALQKCMICLNDGDLHCNPHIVSLLVEFFDRIAGYNPKVDGDSTDMVDHKHCSSMLGTGHQRFGFSNFVEVACPENESIHFDQFPFITMKNTGGLSNFSSSPFGSSNWRKSYHTRTRRSRSSKSFTRKGSKMVLFSSSKSGLDTMHSYESGRSNEFIVDISLFGVRVHFHDSSCIVGTITLPMCKSAFFFYGQSIDILCSTEGLTLTSSWTKRLYELLWGPAVTNLHPILNVRVRIQNAETNPNTEISIGLQHVCCILPAEYLAILIGYFSLPDWISNSSKQSQAENNNNLHRQQSVIYKIEILDSILISPVEKVSGDFLKLEIPQLYSSFVPKITLNGVLEGIPFDCSVPKKKVAERNHALNVFGQQLSLSLLLVKDYGDGWLNLDQDARQQNLVLISPLSADVWVIIPCEDGSHSESSCNPTSIMGKIEVCEVFVDDGYLLHGIGALVTLTDLFSSVADESKAFTCDVLQFLQAKKCHMGSTIIEPREPTTVLTEVLLSVDSLTMKMHHSLKDLVISEPVAQTDMQFRCSISLRDNTIESMTFSFSSLAVYSLLSSVVLARCTSTSLSSVLGIKLSKSEASRDEITIFLPSLHIWLELVEWTKVIDSLNLFAGQLTQLVIMESSSKDPISGSSLKDNGETALPEHSCPVSDCDTSDSTKPDRRTLLMRSENIGITFHFPFMLSNNGHGECGKSEFLKREHHRLPSIVTRGKQRKFVAVTLVSKNAELFSDFKMYRLNFNIEKASALAGIYEENDNDKTWPFLQIFKVTVETEVHVSHTEIVHVAVDIQCDHTDIGLSHSVFHFFRDVELYAPEGGSPEISLDSIDCKVRIRKVSLLLTDGRWSCSGPLLEILTRNLILHANATKTLVECSVASDLELNYNNIHKVMWEPFMEPWKFQLNMTLQREVSVLLNSSILTDVHFKSVAPLNLNCTESLLECFCRTIEMVLDAWDLNQSNDPSEKHVFFEFPVIDNISAGRYAPYILQNLTSLPLTYQILRGSFNPIEALVQDIEYWDSVQPDSFMPIYIKETPEEQLLRFRPAHSSDRLNEKQSTGVTHHFIRIQLDGTTPSVPISMDLVGVSYFEVDFSKEPSRLGLDGAGEILKKPNDVNGEDKNGAESGFVLPVVSDVSISRFSKLIRIYSTVILLNETSLPLELRFDIPLGVSPKVIDPIYPGQKFPLPLHLAEAGRVRWRPLGGSYVWSEAHSLSNILSQESKIGSHRSFVCYPSHPSSDPFRCCLAIEKISLPSSKKVKQVSFHHSRGRRSMDEIDPLFETDKSEKRFIYQLMLCTPLVVHNYLPEPISLTIDSGGVSHPLILSEVDSFFHHVDPSHDLGLIVCMQGFQPSISRFPHMESFSAQAKFDGRKFTQTETLFFDPVVCNCPIYVTMEKTMDAFSGARELFLCVPFLLYNCIGFPLSISVSTNEVKETVCTVPSCYNFVERDLFEIKKDGLSLLSSDERSYASASQTNPSGNLSMRNPILSNRRNLVRHGVKLPGKSSTFSGPTSIERDKCGGKNETESPSARTCLSYRSSLMNSSFVDNPDANVKPYAYSPNPMPSSMDNIVTISKYLPEDVIGSQTSRVWSNPFPLFPPSGSNSVLIPLPGQNAAYILSVSSVTVPEQLTGRTRAITFQPRYVICNACSKDLCYKQKGTDTIFHLGMGQHSHLHWTDTTRDLLISICYNEPGWQWAGSFLPDILGDTQVKMWNYISGALNMIRVEVQNANMSIKDGKIATRLHRISGTNLILLSDDDTGYMPYRVENFSKERLRIYQQRCENFETIVHPYQSSPYAWDEPCYPHRLTVEVPGERVLGSYALDDVKDIINVHLPSTSEKPDRTLLISVRAEGATKVLSVVDSMYHVNMFHDNKKFKEEQASFSDYKESFSVYIPHIGISLISSLPQEMIFACAKGISLDLLQSVDRQKLCFQVTSLQIDNQLHTTPYPVILSFDHDYRSISANHDGSSQSRFEDLQLHTNVPCEPAFHLSLSKWRKKDESLSSFESITLRVADFHLELEQEIVLNLYDFFKVVYSRFENRTLPSSDPGLLPYLSGRQLFNDPLLTHPDLSIDKTKDGISASLPSIVPIGAPRQHIYHLARRQKKIYVELFDLAPINFSLSFSSAPWMHRIGISMSGDSLMHRGLIALADIEGAQICLKQLTISHHMASWESIQEILVRHYSRQVLHEMYKVFGSAGVIGNPMGFARSLGLGIRDFLSVPLRNILQSPTGLVKGMAQGTTSLFSRTVYALSDAATQFSKAAQKGIVALTFDEQAVAKMEMQQRGATSLSHGVINEVLEGLTGLLQSPIRGAEKHGLPGVLSGTALGLTGLVARPAASILEVTGKTAQSIRNRSEHYQLGAQRRRVRLPRPLSKDLPLRPYSWEEAIGTFVLIEADDSMKLKNEVLVLCKALEQAGKFVILTETSILIISCPSLVGFNKPEFHGISANPEWVIESEIALDSVIHADSNECAVHVVGSSSRASKQNQLPYRGLRTRGHEWNNPPSIPLFQTDLELASKEEADNLLKILLSTIELGRGRGRDGGYVLHQCDIK